MKKYYQEPALRIYTIRTVGVICLSGGKVGGEGKPGADFDSDDIFDGDIF